jgi:hypothetical protein
VRGFDASKTSVGIDYGDNKTSGIPTMACRKTFKKEIAEEVCLCLNFISRP